MAAAYIHKMALMGIPGKVIDTITKKLGLQTAVERSTFDLAQTIQPIIDADEKISDLAFVGTGTGVIYTGKPNIEFFITAIHISGAIVNAAGISSDNVSVIMPNGESQIIADLKLSSAAVGNDSGNVSINFTKPLKIMKGSSVTFTNAALNGRAVLFGYEIQA